MNSNNTNNNNNNNNDIKYVVDINDLRNHLNNNAHQQQQQQKINDDSTLNRQVFQINNDYLNSTIQRPSAMHNQQLIYQQSLDSQSMMIPTLSRQQAAPNLPVRINQPTMFQVDNFTLNSKHPIYEKSIDSQSFNPTMNRSVYNYSSKGQMNQLQQGGSAASVAAISTSTTSPNNNINKTNRIEFHSNGFGCCRFFYALFSFFCGCLQCFTNCCFRPCCSTAAILAGFTGLGGLLAGIMVMGVIGVLPLPVEFTKNICNMDRHRTFINYNDNQTMFNISNKMHGGFNNNFTTSFDLISSARNNITNNFNNLTDINNINSQNSYISQMKQKKKKEKFKNKLKIRIYCFNTTNVIQLSTREFSNIELNFEDSLLSVKKWSYDSASNILEIETIKNFTHNHLYTLNVLITFKNYGFNSVLASNIKQQQQFYFLSFNEKFENPFPVIVENNNQFQTFSGPSVFNISIAKVKSNQILISNMDISNM